MLTKDISFETDEFFSKVERSIYYRVRLPHVKQKSKNIILQ